MRPGDVLPRVGTPGGPPHVSRALRHSPTSIPRWARCVGMLREGQQAHSVPWARWVGRLPVG
eukprot:scaffold64349_cov24-Tisochrysis_lutea.AAC.1